MKKDTQVKDFFAKMLNPYSPIIVLVVGGLVSSFVNVVEISLGLILYGLSLWFVIACGYQIHTSIADRLQDEIKKAKKEIDKYKNIVEEKDSQIKRNVGLIEARYGEFSEYLKKEKYRVLSEKIVKKFSYIDSVQIYEYTIGAKNGDVEIKIKYDMGAEYEGININIIKQKYYIIDKIIYLEFLCVQKLYNDLISSGLHKTDKMKEVFIEKVFNLLEKLSDDYTAVNYRIFILLVEMLKEIDKSNYYGELIENNKDDSFRSGILGSILSNRDYMYYYNKDKSEKFGRTYFSFNDIIEGENKIVTLVINNHTIDREHIEELIREVIAYYENLYNSLLIG